MLLAVLSLLACNSESTERAPKTPDAPAECRDGHALEADGHCYPVDDVSLDQALRQLPACEPLALTGSIDLKSGCADGACFDMTYAEISVELDEDGDCATTSFDADRMYCSWSLGLEGIFYDNDRDKDPDPGDTNIAQRIHLFPPYDGATKGGSGVGANPRCFIDELGTPDYVELIWVEDDLGIRRMEFWEAGLTVLDDGTDDSSGLPNGYIDHAYLYGEQTE